MPAIWPHGVPAVLIPAESAGASWRMAALPWRRGGVTACPCCTGVRIAKAAVVQQAHPPAARLLPCRSAPKALYCFSDIEPEEYQ